MPDFATLGVTLGGAVALGFLLGVTAVLLSAFRR
jgi:hypothetical protein